jgi:tetratricopeptide (TPR) repeat protein
MAVFARHLADERNRANREAERANEEAHASQQAAKVLSELVRVDLSGGLFSNRTLDPKDVARVVSSIEARWPSKPQAAAELLEHVGVSLVLAGSYEAAIRFIERAIEIRRDVLHEPDWEFAGPRIALGEYYVIVGRLRDAEALFSSALARARGNASVSPVNLGYLLEDLGCVRRDLRRLAEGESLIREALALYEAAQPRWLPYVASAHDSLGTLDLARGDLAAAVLDALGELYLADGKLDRADDALRRSLSAYDASLPPNTPARATALVHLAELRRRQRRAAEARDALARAVAIRETALGPEHVETIRAAETLAGLDGGRRL